MAENLILLMPDKTDIERDAVAKAWKNAGGQVLRLARFWEPPDLPADAVRLYGNHIFCLVIQEKMAIRLISPSDYFLLSHSKMKLGALYWMEK